MTDAAPDVVFTPKQKQYLASNARFLLYGGGAGGGKTHVAIYDMLGLNNPGGGKRAIDIPEYTGLFLRRTMPQLREVIRRTQQVYPEWGRDPKTGEEPVWREQQKAWIFPSGARIFFGFVDRFEHVYNYQGWEYQTICFEELTQWPTSAAFMYLHTRLRKLANNPMQVGMRATCNPGGVGHTWVRKFWQIGDDGAPTRFSVPITVEIDGEEHVVDMERQFIPSLLDENPFLSRAEYAAALEDGGQTEQMRDALRFGRWDVVDLTGVPYAAQINRLHNENSIRDVPYDDRFPVNTFWDLGIADQTSIWFHQRIDGVDRFIDYYEASNRSLKDHWRELKMRPYLYGLTFIPHDANARQHSHDGSIMTIADIMEDLGIPSLTVVPRTYDTRQAIEQVRIVLPQCRFDDVKTERGIECLTNYRFKIPEDGSLPSQPVHDEFSHGADAFRQFAQSFDLIEGALEEYAQTRMESLVPDVPHARHVRARPQHRRWVV